MAQLKDLPIGRKLGIVARLSVLIALGVALLTIFLTEVNSELRRADEDGRMLSEIVADNAISPLRFDDAKVAVSLLGALRRADQPRRLRPRRADGDFIPAWATPGSDRSA